MKRLLKIGFWYYLVIYKIVIFILYFIFRKSGIVFFEIGILDI